MNCPDFIVWLRYLDNMCNVIVCLSGCDVMNFEIKEGYISNKVVFLHDQKSRQKI